ncbi:MAG: FAD:protein FMN transferase [Verrucomicrobiota bacterium]
MNRLHTFTFARHAMATRFEIVLPGDHEPRLRAAAEEAFNEIDRLEAQLSLFRPTSEIAHVNAHAAAGPVRVSPETFRLLQHAARLSRETGGAFDITIAPLMRAWGFRDGSGHLPDPMELAAARDCVGMQRVHLDGAHSTVRFDRPGVMLDLGALGKGYAVERAAELLREAGIESALIHGGTSTAYALGQSPEGSPWKIAVEYPRTKLNEPPPLLAEISLVDEALSMSAGWGKSFHANGRDYGHVLDPRTGEPADNALLAVVVTASAADGDALSTALLTTGAAGMECIAALRPNLRAVTVGRGNGPKGYVVAARGVHVFPFPKAA